MEHQKSSSIHLDCLEVPIVEESQSKLMEDMPAGALQGERGTGGGWGSNSWGQDRWSSRISKRFEEIVVYNVYNGLLVVEVYGDIYGVCGGSFTSVWP